MKILIISHNVISNTGNMGMTLRNYFRGMKDVEIAQYYIQSEIPNNDEVCQKYYRFTDLDAIKSILPGIKVGKRLNKEDIQKERNVVRINNNNLNRIYSRGRKRTPFIYFGRNFVWKLSKWYSEDLKTWIQEFNPDLVFLASGDYAFIYNIAQRISKDMNCPLVVSCFDDYYKFHINYDSLLGRLQHKFFMKVVHKTMKQSRLIVTVCETMKKEYQDIFKKRSIVLYTASSTASQKSIDSGRQISYIGNLSLGRYKQLIAIGRILKNLDSLDIPKYIDVYSTESSEEVLSQMTEENGICFHGAIVGEEKEKVLENTMLSIHTESFDEDMVQRVRYSVSTKIAELCFSGPCILAYGPAVVASVDYLKTNNAAYVITSEENLMNGLIEICTNQKLRSNIIKNARNLAAANHNPKKNVEYLRNELQRVVNENK